jgi:hypothetical protein
MQCIEFEERLTDYLDGYLTGETLSAFMAHSERCPVCHDLISEVQSVIGSCSNLPEEVPPSTLQARILLATAPNDSMNCNEFEEHLTDYLDGFLPASLYHQWERHATLCKNCTNLPGDVVRSIGACYSYLNEELAVPANLHEKILQATIGTTMVAEIKVPLWSRVKLWTESVFEALLLPQFATVATMLLLFVLVGTSTISEDGTIAGMYRASLKIAAQSYTYNGGPLPRDLQSISSDWTDFFTGPDNQEIKQ